MKKFLYSFLGTIAGIWVSVILGTLLIFLTIGVIAASGDSKGSVKIKDDSILHLQLNGTVADRASTRNLIDELYGTETATINLNDIVDAIYPFALFPVYRTLCLETE